MENLQMIYIILLSYLMGSIPMGYLVVKVITGKELTDIGSGRTGGTNAYRAGGIFAFIITGLLDFTKGFLVIKLSSTLAESHIWYLVFSGIACVMGHNWSIWVYLITKYKNKPRLSAGAGTAPNIGVATSMWPPISFALIPIILFVVFIIGYASLASIISAVLIPIIFAITYILLGTPWEFIIYGILSAIIIIISLIPNIKRLVQGKENRVSIKKIFFRQES